MIRASRRRILLVEDDADIAAVAKLALEMDGEFEVESASCGVEALASASRLRPDAILLDVMMPGMDGPATLERLRQLPGLDRVPVIFMTARAQRDAIDRYLALGAAGVVAKPFDPMELGRSVSALLARKEDHR